MVGHLDRAAVQGLYTMSSWLFAAALAQAQQLKHDAERVAASTLFHDIGLTTAFTGEVRFEVFDANAVGTSSQAVGLTRAASRSFGTLSRFIQPRRLRTSRRSKWLAANVALEWTTEVQGLTGLR